MSAPVAAGRRLTQTEAIIEAIMEEMRRDERIFYMGQDVGVLGGSMQGTNGLHAAFGADRVLEAPIAEAAMVGAALGAALFGRRPIVEISFGEFLPAAMNQLINQAPNLHYMTGGAVCAPVVIRTRVGNGPYGGHPQDYSSWFAHVPGLKVVTPATPADAKGLMLSALRDANPVLFIESMSLAHGPRGDVPVADCAAPIGVARLARPGRDVTVVATGSMVPVAERAATALSREGIEAEIIDLRSLAPWDSEAMLTSLRRTHRLVVTQETWPTAGFSAEVVATAVERALPDLHVPPVRVGAEPVPIPSGPLRRHALPSAARLTDVIRHVAREETA